MPKNDINAVEETLLTVYPKQFQHLIAGRRKRRIGDAAGLTHFGVNITRIKPGSHSALRHWHETEDEFIYVLDGELVLIEDGGETVLKPGDCAAFKAQSRNGHCLVNRTERDATYLEVGTRSASERMHYPDDDLIMERDETSRRYLRKSGGPYPDDN